MDEKKVEFKIPRELVEEWKFAEKFNYTGIYTKQQLHEIKVKPFRQLLQKFTMGNALLFRNAGDRSLYNLDNVIRENGIDSKFTNAEPIVYEDRESYWFTNGVNYRPRGFCYVYERDGVYVWIKKDSMGRMRERYTSSPTAKLMERFDEKGMHHDPEEFAIEYTNKKTGKKIEYSIDRVNKEYVKNITTEKWELVSYLDENFLPDSPDGPTIAIDMKGTGMYYYMMNHGKYREYIPGKSVSPYTFIFDSADKTLRVSEARTGKIGTLNSYDNKENPKEKQYLPAKLVQRIVKDGQMAKSYMYQYGVPWSFNGVPTTSYFDSRQNPIKLEWRDENGRLTVKYHNTYSIVNYERRDGVEFRTRSRWNQGLPVVNNMTPFLVADEKPENDGDNYTITEKMWVNKKRQKHRNIDGPALITYRETKTYYDYFENGKRDLGRAYNSLIVTQLDPGLCKFAQEYKNLDLNGKFREGKNPGKIIVIVNEEKSRIIGEYYRNGEKVRTKKFSLISLKNGDICYGYEYRNAEGRLDIPFVGIHSQEINVNGFENLPFYNANREVVSRDSPDAIKNPLIKHASAVRRIFIDGVIQSESHFNTEEVLLFRVVWSGNGDYNIYILSGKDIVDM